MSIYQYGICQAGGYQFPVILKNDALVYVGSFSFDDCQWETIMQRFNQRHTIQWQQFEQCPQWVVQPFEQYFQGELSYFSFELAWEIGTPFQQQVWRLLQEVPYGQAKSYGELANQLGNPRAVRAVAQAVGKNPWSIVVPCHRILSKTGELTGYAGGLKMKQALLQLEGIDYQL